MPAIIQSIGDTKSYEMWMKAGSNKLHHTKRFGYEPGTIVLCINKDTASILGVAIIKTACSEHHLLDPDLYTEEYAKYNKYECDITFREFARPLSCNDVSKMCGADPAKQSWFLYLSMCTCYLAGEKVPAIVKEAFQKLVMTWV